MSAHHAVGTSMAAVLATSCGSAASYAAHGSELLKNESKFHMFGTSIPRYIGSIDVAAVICIVATASICAPLGARVSKFVSDLFLRRAQAGLMILAGMQLALRFVEIFSPLAFLQVLPFLFEM